MKNKKIGIVTTWFERGAAYVSKQFKEAWELENEIFIYARGGESVAKGESNWNVKNLTYGKRYRYTRLDIIEINHFKKWIQQNELDIVFFNEQHMWKPVIACKELGILIGSYIDYYKKETVELFEIYDFLICNTKRHYSVFKWHPQVFYIPWGTNTKIYNKKQQKKVDKKQITFFHSAGMNPYRKGTDYVIKAFYQLNSSSSKLIIHTQTNILDRFPSLKHKFNSLINNKRLEVIHKTVPAPGLYHRGDVYLYPSRLEGIGLTIAEASACGMPVITSNVPPMNEFVVEDVNGKLVAIESSKTRRDGYYWKESYIDINDLVSKMHSYESNIENLELYKSKSLQFAQEKLSWDKNALKLLDIWKEIKPLNASKDCIHKIVLYEKERGIKFYIGNLVLYQRLKFWIKKTIS